LLSNRFVLTCYGCGVCVAQIDLFLFVCSFVVWLVLVLHIAGDNLFQSGERAAPLATSFP